MRSYLFIEFATAEEAAVAIQQVQNFQLDSKHTFSLNRFNDVERFEKLDEAYVPPESDLYNPRVGLNFTAMFPVLMKNRSIFVLGSQTHKAETNMSHTVPTT